MKHFLDFLKIIACVALLLALFYSTVFYLRDERIAVCKSWEPKLTLGHNEMGALEFRYASWFDAIVMDPICKESK